MIPHLAHRSLVSVGFVEQPAGQAGADKAAEVRALQDVRMGTVEGVGDGLTGGQGPGDLLVELGQLVPGELPPLVRSNCRGGDEGFLLGEGEPGVAQEQNDADEADCRFGIAALPGDPGGWGKEAKLLVVAQGRRRNPNAAGQLANCQQSMGHLDFKGT